MGSTPALNVFLLLRAWHGVTPATILFFAFFALKFFLVRILLNGVNVVHCYYTFFNTPEAFVTSQLESYMILIILLAGMGLQLNWGKVIAKKLIWAIRGGKEDKEDKEDKSK